MKISMMSENLFFNRLYKLKLFPSQCLRQVQPNIVPETIFSLLCRAKTKFWNASKILSDFQNNCFPDFSCSSGACSWTCAGYLQCIFLFLHTFERSLMQSDNMLLDWPSKQDSHDDGAHYKSFINIFYMDFETSMQNLSHSQSICLVARS